MLKKNLKKIIEIVIDIAFFIIIKIPHSLYLVQVLNTKLRSNIQSIKFEKDVLFFSVPNYLIKKRVESIFYKEKITVEWLKSLDKNNILWDIGANIGLYSIIGSKFCKTVYAFEPSILNTETLATNISINNIENIILMPFPLAEKTCVSKMNISSSEAGASQSTFKYEIDQNGDPIKSKINYRTLGLSINDLVELNLIEKPDYIKLDVDGIEHHILSGSDRIISGVKSILVEVNYSFLEQHQNIDKFMKEHNYTLKREEFLGSKNMKNQIWEKI